MADEIIPYLKFNPKLGGYKTIEIESLPFPPHHLPEIFNLSFFFIEKNIRGYFLRSTMNSLFCCYLYEVTTEIEVPDWDVEQEGFKYDEHGEIIQKIASISYLCLTVEGKERTVAYSYEGKGKCYLSMHISDVPFEDLDQKLQKLYLGAKLLSNQYIAHYEAEIEKRNSNFSYLKPKGDWEAEMFRDVFNNNPNAMSDSEYEMIFGVER